MTPYSYGPLTDKSGIRVLHVSPGNDDEPLRGTLVHVNLDTHPFYKALSYTWGELDFSCRINLDGNELAITSGLDSALRRLRSSDEVVIIWADAICVNQKDIAERNQQVSLMRRVYSECEECMIYLGKEGDNSDIVPGSIRELYNGFIGLYHNEGIRPFENILYFSHDSHPSIPRENHPGWAAFRFLMSRP